MRLWLQRFGSAVRLSVEADARNDGEEVPMTAVIALIAALILLNAAVVRFGADSRDGDDWIDHSARR